MIRALDRYSREILSLLSEDGGFLTKRVAEQVVMTPHSKRMNSQWVRGALVRLMELGLVEPLDDQKPICRKRTAKGTEALGVSP